MNSSGIKRGLAVSAVSALAVAGIPALASSASAAAGDSITVVSAGPALNGGAVGAQIVLRTKGVDETLLDLTAVNSALAGSEDTADQSADIVAASATKVADPDNPGFDLITLRVKTTTATTGDTASFRVFEDDGATAGTLEASEARANVSVSTAGALKSIDVQPSSQSTSQGLPTGSYTATLKDAQGRTTQLAGGDTVVISTSNGTVSTTESAQTITAVEAASGTRSFKATTTNATPIGSHTITLTDQADNTIKGTASVNVTPAAAVNAGMVDIVTGADNWNGFGNPNDNDGDATTTSVRVDQASIRIDIKGSTPGGTVTLTVDGDKANTGGVTDVTFGGKKSTTVSTVLDSNGNGSLTIAADALSVQEGDLVNVGGSFTQTLSFERSAPSVIDASQNPYFGKLGGSVDVTVTVTDQFGAPVTSGFIGAKRVAGPNSVNDPQQAKAVDATGSATFTFTDTKATNGQLDTVGFGYVKDQFQDPATASPTGSTQIKWTTDGQGANFVTSIGGDSTESATYDPAKHTVVPLADAKVDEAGESLALAVAGVENNATVTISVDNGALILAPGKTDLSDGKSSVTVTLAGQNLPNGYTLVGTKAGLVTVTTSATNRTETAKFTVSNEVDKSTARNVTVSGPAEVDNGTTQIPFTAVVTDAFGNPVANVPVTDLNVQVTGPAQFQDSDAVTNAAGELHLNVRVDAGAAGDVTIKVQGFGEQFGAAADQLTSSSPANSAKGLAVSSNVATATTTVKAGEPEPTPVDPGLVVSGKGGKIDRVKGNASSDAAGATATLWVKGKKVKTGTLNSAGDIVFKIKDKNGNKATKYTVKIGATTLTLADSASKRIR